MCRGKITHILDSLVLSLKVAFVDGAFRFLAQTADVRHFPQMTMLSSIDRRRSLTRVHNTGVSSLRVISMRQQRRCTPLCPCCDLLEWLLWLRFDKTRLNCVNLN